MKTRADFSCDADWYRHHRKVFEHAQELGCTPREAEQELGRIEAREKHRAQMDRLKAKMAGTPQIRTRDLPDERWMMRN